MAQAVGTVEAAAEHDGRARRGIEAACVALLVLSAAVLSAVSLKWFSHPFVWTGCVWTVMLLGSAWLLKIGLLRVLLFNLAMLVIVLGATETYFSFREQSQPAYSDPYTLSDDVLGTAPVKGVQAYPANSNMGNGFTT